MRMAHRGPSAGDYFWGCARYPACRGSLSVAEVEDDDEDDEGDADDWDDLAGVVSSRAPSAPYGLDSFVYTRDRGFGKVHQVDGRMVDVEFFRSTGPSGRFVEHLPQSLVYPRNPVQGQTCRYRRGGLWHAGRIASVSSDEVFVRESDRSGSVSVPIKDVFVRCRGELPDPVAVAADGVLDHPAKAVARAEWTDALYRLRGASRGMAGLVSSRIELHRHQVEIVSRILRDPLQRYLLADEVGLGKTIEAGVVLHQFLLDNQGDPASVIVPELLAGQWNRELRQKFAIDEFDSDRVRVWSHHADSWTIDDCGLLIVDEVHHLAAGALSDDVEAAERYELLAELARRAERVLLLSATPLLHNETTFLGMLHLIDPALYPLEDLEGFKRRVQDKREFAYRFQAFDPSASDYLIEEHAAAFLELLPNDQILSEMLSTILRRIDKGEIGDDAFVNLVRRARVHLGETYRLHRRVLRTRRDSPLAADFPVRGREAPAVLRVAAANQDEVNLWMEDWFDVIAGRLIDGKFEPVVLTMVVGLLDRLSVDPGVTAAFLRSWLGESDDQTAGLTERERSAIGQWRPDGREREQLLALAELLATSEASGRWATRVASEVRQWPPGTVVFCGYAHAAATLSEALVDELGPLRVALFIGDETEAAERSFSRFATGQAHYLICGPAAEEGRNIQFAKQVFHAHVPWDPSRLEQRIGRLDRFGVGDRVSGAVIVPPRSITADWVELLRLGFGVWDESIATLQHVLEGTVAEALALAVAEGMDSWGDFAVRLKERLSQERREILQLENLESIEAESPFAGKLFEDLAETEADEDKLGRQIDGWLGGGIRSNGGLGLEIRPELEQRTIRTYHVPRNGDLPIPKEVLHEYLGQFVRQRATISRRTAARHPEGLHFLRPGGAFFEAIRSLTSDDDVGQTFGYWRRGPFDEPEAVLVFNYRLEAPADPASVVLRDAGVRHDRATLQRVLDGFLGPASLQFRFDQMGEPLSDAIAARVEAPFSPRSDEPLLSQHIRPMEQSLDVDWSEWWERIGTVAAERATQEAELRQRKHAAVDQARKAFHDARDQIRLRQQAEGQERRIERLGAELLETEVLQQAVEAAVDAATPVAESVGLILVCRDRPEDLWGGNA